MSGMLRASAFTAWESGDALAAEFLTRLFETNEVPAAEALGA
ncbi:MAG TPA: hypothetical protein VEI47_08540 [Gemmatimonadales bacterium]|jgi:hypothetical protein|nr:hypothetical protein [Gemmatimonadales bacterium]